jgi:orotidine-5'-phosphate decarboxylase
MHTFHERFAFVSEQNQSLLCVGLDPEPTFDWRVVLDFNKAVIESTIDLACAYKPNLAIYESMGSDGLTLLDRTLRFIRELNPNMPVIGDAKRGDIGPCSLAYVRTMFDSFEFDAVTVSPYMGFDSLKPFINHEHGSRGVFILCRTSNPSGTDLQDLTVLDEQDGTPKPLYEVVAGLANKWNVHGNIGLVVGATVPAQMERIREVVPDMLFLIPGIGPQGGDLGQTVSSAVDSRGKGFMINASRQIMYAEKNSSHKRWTKSESPRSARGAAEKLREEINRELASAMALKDQPTIPEEVHQIPMPVG